MNLDFCWHIYTHQHSAHTACTAQKHSTQYKHLQMISHHSHIREHPDVQTHACEPTETRCKWFSVSQPAPGHSQTTRSQPERDRCQRGLPDHSVWLLGAAENLPDIGLLSVTHTQHCHIHTHALSSKVRLGSHLSQKDKSSSVSIDAARVNSE